ncbi:MAG: hypothetical protein ACK2T0_09860 [Anaerolineales bacterium]|jgi:biotin operon repressor
MIDPQIHERKSSLSLKEPAGWFAAGASFHRALRTLSDGAFKLFAHLCLEADRRTGRFDAGHEELAQAIGKSRRIVGKYIQELESRGVCAVHSGRNQHARTCLEIRDEYWPYDRHQEETGADGQGRNAYVDSVKGSFAALGCTGGKFSARDVQVARTFQQRGVPLQTVQDALLMGATRKYISWLNGGSPEPIGSLAYFDALVSEMQQRPLRVDYRHYLQEKVVQLGRVWAKKSANDQKKGGCPDMACCEIVQ